MKKIPSFEVDHTKLHRGIYVSRYDITPNGDTITTFDIRVKEPNVDFMLPEAAHTIEHIGATFLRNNDRWGDKIVYFGPMGCLTGFYLILNGDYDSHQIVELMQELFTTVRDWNTDIPGATEKECGNAYYHSLEWAKHIASEYLSVLNNITAENLSYPK